jgi:hypothetical protein
VNFNETHAGETFKSLISISVEGLKSILLLNGGAIIAILAYLGEASSGQQLAARLKCSLVWFVVGLITISLAFVTSYLTQLALFNESVNSNTYKGPKHQLVLWTTVALGITSLVSFSCGAFSTVNVLATTAAGY